MVADGCHFSPLQLANLRACSENISCTFLFFVLFFVFHVWVELLFFFVLDFCFCRFRSPQHRNPFWVPGARACFLSSARRFLCARFLVGPGIVGWDRWETMSDAMTSVVHSVPVRCEMMASNDGLQSREKIITDLGASGREGANVGSWGCSARARCRIRPGSPVGRANRLRKYRYRRSASRFKCTMRRALLQNLCRS